MADMLTPLEWELPDEAPKLRSDDKVSRDAFRWPTPPYASYPEATAQTDPLPCQIVGLNDKEMNGRLTFFVPEEGVAHVQLPPARTTLPLRFDQFRSLCLTTPLVAAPSVPGDPHAGLLNQRARSEYRVRLRAGGLLTGQTVGHVEMEIGVFLFPPTVDDSGVLRLFIPRPAYESVEIGQRIGEVLVDHLRVPKLEIDHAVGEQQGLRRQKLGDILVMRQVVSPEQLLEAIKRQEKMPMVRIGDALISLGMINDEQLKGALEQQQNDRSVPLGELLVRRGVVSREDLQVALARKMGYPLVDLDAFPAEPEALKKISYAMAKRLHLMPLLIRDGRLVVALDDPARRRAAVDEVEFSAQMKAVPVLAQCRSMEALLRSAYEKIGDTAVGPAMAEESVPELMFVEHDTDKLVETLEKEGHDRNGNDNEPPIEQSDNSLVRLINNMIIEAHKEGVSDIHIESYPGREKIRIRFRKDGLLRTYLELPSNYRNALIARIKIMCDLDISERRKPQDGKINFGKFSPQHKIELRVASIPTNSGLEDVVMRILASAKPIPLDRVGLSPYNLAALKTAIERPYGMVLCVGPTG